MIFIQGDQNLILRVINVWQIGLGARQCLRKGPEILINECFVKLPRTLKSFSPLDVIWTHAAPVGKYFGVGGERDGGMWQQILQKRILSLWWSPSRWAIVEPKMNKELPLIFMEVFYPQLGLRHSSTRTAS